MPLLLAALLSCLALPARALPVASSDDLDYWYVDIYQPFFAARPLSDGRIMMEPQRSRSHAESFVKGKPQNTFRVFIIGGSVANQFDSDPRASRGWTLSKTLEQAFPQRRVEVIHCGMGAYDSYRDSLVLDEVLGYEPDLVVLMSGNNESSLAAGPPPAMFRAALEARKLLHVDSAVREQVTQARTTTRDYLGDFAHNLSAMIRRAKAAGVPLALCTLPRHLGLPPAESLPLMSAPFLAAWLQWEEGNRIAAEAAFRRCEILRPEDPFGPLWVGRCREAAGDAAGARRAYERALALQGEKLPQINEIIRQTSRNEGAFLVDLASAFAGAAGDARGEGLIYDAMHWSRFVDPLVSLTIARSLAARTGLPVAAGADDGWLEQGNVEAISGGPITEEAERIFLSRADTAFWDSDRHGGGFNEFSVALLEYLVRDRPRRLSAYLADRQDFQRRTSQNLWVHPSSAAIAGCWASGLAHAAEAYRRQGRPGEADRYFEQSLRLDPSFDAARAHLLLALQASGKAAQAKKIIAQTPELIRRFPEVRVLLEAFAKRSAEVTGTAVRQNRSPDAKQGQGIDNCPERELGSLAAFRPALKETFAAFEARQWDAGFARLNKTLPDFFPARAAELEGFCASRSQTCAPWSSAKDELTKLRRQAFLDFETGRSSAAAEEFARLSAWSPTDPAPAAALAHPEEALALYTDEELGPLATARDSLKSAFAAFAAHEWDEGFRQLEPATKRLADLDDFCAQRARTCGPWLQAKEEIRRINDDGMKAFLAGDRRGAARTFDGVLAWLPAEPSTLVNRAVTADAEGDSALALKLYDAAASLPQTSTLYQAEVLTSRAALLERLGHKALALADLKRADKTAPPDWPRREDTRRQILKLAGPEGSVQ